jgi:hypothetical protein
MVTKFIHTKMEIDMKDIGWMIKGKGKANIFMLMEIDMRENIRMIKRRG